MQEIKFSDEMSQDETEEVMEEMIAAGLAVRVNGGRYWLTRRGLEVLSDHDDETIH